MTLLHLPLRRRTPAPQAAALTERLEHRPYHVTVLVNDEIVIRTVTAPSALDARRTYLQTIGRKEAIVRIDPA